MENYAGGDVEADQFIERRIVTGLIVSRDYVQRVRPWWREDLLEAAELRRVSGWCLDHFDKYGKVPDSDISDIYLNKLKTEQIPSADAEFIEEILGRISDEYGRGDQFNSAYLYDRTVEYLKQRQAEAFNDQYADYVERGMVEEAEKLRLSFTPLSFGLIRGLELSSDEAAERIRQAFSETTQSVLKYPGALGEMWNEHLIRGGLIGLLAPEKRGKTFMLLDLALRAIRQKSNVAFFQAGDMTEAQQLKRICVYLTRRSDRARYCEAHWYPVGDCVLNQIDKCNRNDRNCDHGIYDTLTLKDYQDDRTKLESISELTQASADHPDYQPCSSRTCKKRIGTVWMIKEPERLPLTVEQAEREIKKFFDRYKRRFKLATYPNGTLTCEEIRSCLDEWEHSDDFVPDLIVVDYADLMDANEREHRHRHDAIWKGLRAISQERHALLATATQADAASYKQTRLGLSNFSEDKRKYAHVTGMWGLNQDPAGREKKLGIMRINELVVREGEFSVDNEVKILQDLWIGRPFLESYK